MTQEEYHAIQTRENTLMFLITELIGATWDDIRDAYILTKTEDLDLLEWDDYEYIEITPVKTENDRINGVLLFGDGTIEFHYENSQEAINYAEHSFEIIDKVIDTLARLLQ